MGPVAAEWVHEIARRFAALAEVPLTNIPAPRKPGPSLVPWVIGGVLVLPFVLAACRRLALAIRTRRRIQNGQCRYCGYDLRASPRQCPECGTIYHVGP
jgi:hypothetical protein